jgi:hypothetical protein
MIGIAIIYTMTVIYLGIGLAQLILDHDAGVLVLAIVPLSCLMAIYGDITSSKTDRERRPWLYHK